MIYIYIPSKFVSFVSPRRFLSSGFEVTVIEVEKRCPFTSVWETQQSVRRTSSAVVIFEMMFIEGWLNEVLKIFINLRLVPLVIDVVRKLICNVAFYRSIRSFLDFVICPSNSLYPWKRCCVSDVSSWRNRLKN